jgi:hypothetical protein
MERYLLVPGPKRTTAKLDVESVTDTPWSIPPNAMSASCVPTPYAQAEMMGQVLNAINQTTWQLTPPVQATEVQSQTLDRWVSLLLGVVEGKLRIRTESLNSSEADNFGRMLQRARPAQRYLGLLEVEAPLGSGLDKGTVCGAIDSRSLVWCTPRLDPATWQSFGSTVASTTQDGQNAMQVLWEWRSVLRKAELWPEGANSPPWVRGIEHILHGFKPDATGNLLDHQVRFAGPLALDFGNDREYLVYLPVLARNWAQTFLKYLNLRPTPGTTPMELRDDSGRGGARIHLSAGATGGADGAGAIEHQVDSKDAPLAGLGVLELGGSANFGLRPWLTGSDGYEELVYKPLLGAFEKVHHARGIAQPSIERCSVFFPDALRLAYELLKPVEGHSLVRYSAAVQDHSRLFRNLPLRAMNLSRVPTDKPWPKDEELVVAVPGPAPCRALVERLKSLDGSMIDVGELRALGCVLWLLFIGEAEIRGASIDLVDRRGGDRVVGAMGDDLREKEYLGYLYTLVGSDIARASNDLAKRFRDETWKRRATLQRFVRSWEFPSGGDPSDPRRLGAVAMLAFVSWVAGGRRLARFGAGGNADERNSRFAIVGSVEIPILTDQYLHTAKGAPKPGSTEAR